MTTKFRIFIAIGMLGIAAGILFNVLGSGIAEDGILIEPFFLIPLAYMLILVGFGGALINFLWRRFKA